MKKKEEIIKLYNEGKTQTEVANYFNTSTSSISTRLRKWGVSNPDGNRFKRVDIDKTTLYDMYWNKEMHPVQIGEKYGITKMAVIRKMQKFGISMRTKSEARKGKLNPLYNVGHTDGAKCKMSEAFAKGRKIGFNNHWGVGAYYKTPNQGEVWMRSGWEVKVAEYLTEQGLDWYYEAHWLQLSENQQYLPDFYIPKLNLYIEVKGRVKDKDRRIIKLMAEKKYKYLFWDSEELIKRKIISNPGSTKLYRKYVDKEPYIDDWSIYKSN